MNPCVYVLECSDASLYVGSTPDIERRLVEHQEAAYPDCYTATRRPVKLLWTNELPTLFQARQAEYRMKKWTRAKKLAFIQGDVEEFSRLSMSTRQKKRLMKAASKIDK